ncbi:MAG: DUF2177 family protein [Alphaproteobacteria bacterium]|nr:DUF2177 family protein [Alphaproteobacteria bacterium]
MTFFIAYIAVLIVFGIFDAIWISQVALPMYRAMLGDALLDSVRIVPAVIFYLAFPAGVVILAVLPALKDNSVLTAVGMGFVFGLLCYATYDLTNYATLKAWTPATTIIDIAYGAVVGAATAAAGFWAVKAIQS